MALVDMYAANDLAAVFRCMLQCLLHDVEDGLINQLADKGRCFQRLLTETLL